MLLDGFLTSREIQAAEYNANYLGVSNLLLMESAGGAVADAVAAKVKPGGSVVVACGLGGNGGDGFVAARHLVDRGYKVTAILGGNPKLIRSEETRRNYEIAALMTRSLAVKVWDDSSQVEPIAADAVVDALIGYTYRGGLPPVTAAIIRAINASSAYKVSVDLPTGMVADTGLAPEECVEADATVTFHKPKTGFRGKPKQLGKLIVAPLGVPKEAELYTGPGDVLLVHRRRGADDHKGMAGRLLVVGGSETYHGAPTLTTLGALATGIDLCYTAVPEPAAAPAASESPSMIIVKLKGEKLTPKNASSLKPVLEKVDAVAIGPGLGVADETKRAVHEILKLVEKSRIPVVVDADGLKAFAEEKRRLKVPAVFTPHTREFEILTGVKPEGDAVERGRVVEAEAKKLGAVILLKGAVDVISDGAHTRYNWTGNPGMTVGGTGDVLTGLTSGYVAQGASPMQAACAAAFLNGAAGDAVYASEGYHILPEKMIPHIPRLVEDAVAGKLSA